MFSLGRMKGVGAGTPSSAIAWNGDSTDNAGYFEVIFER